MGTYLTGAICRRGHVIATDVSSRPPTPRCKTCGAEVLTACPSCSTPIRGYYRVPGVFMGSNYSAPDFCFACGEPMPWLSREGRIFQLQNILDDESIDPAAQLRVRELLDELISDPDDVGRWQAIRQKAPAFWEHSSVRQIVLGLVEAEAKRKLGI